MDSQAEGTHPRTPDPQSTPTQHRHPSLQRLRDSQSNLSVNFQIASSQETVYKDTTFTETDSNKNVLNSTNPNGRLTPNSAGSHRKNGSIKKYKNELKHLLPYREGNEG